MKINKHFTIDEEVAIKLRNLRINVSDLVNDLLIHHLNISEDKKLNLEEVEEKLTEVKNNKEISLSQQENQLTELGLIRDNLLVNKAKETEREAEIKRLMDKGFKREVAERALYMRENK